MLPLAPDYSGAAAVLFDLGGIVVMHDASGCTGNYTSYDEPRWYGSRSAVFCSGLRRNDAVLGNDEKFIERTLDAAESLDPSLIAFLGSPVPMVIGTDLEGIAAEIEERSGIPCFGLNTTGQNYYDRGASDMMIKLIKRFAEPHERSSTNSKRKVNVLGMLPLDFGNSGNCERILGFIESCGCEITADFAMGLSVDDIRRCTEAELNIVIARSGLAAAKYMKKNFGIPFITGVPVCGGDLFREKLNGKEYRSDIGGGDILIIHEQIFANSFREYIYEKTGRRSTAASIFGLAPSLSLDGDISLKGEEEVYDLINSGRFSKIIADPEFYRILRNGSTELIGLPHLAVSSKLHWNEYPDYLGTDLDEIAERIKHR